MLEKSEILRRISPSTLYVAWRRAHYSQTAWRTRCLKLSAITIALSFHQPAITALLCYAFAIGLIMLYRIPLTDGYFILWDLPSMTKARIESLNAQVIQIIERKATQAAGHDKMSIQDLVKMQSLHAILDAGPFAIQMPQDPETVDRSISAVFKKLHGVHDSLTELAQQHEWIQSLKAHLNAVAQTYVSVVRCMPAMKEEEAIRALDQTGNRYADALIQAMTHPFVPLEQAA